MIGTAAGQFAGYLFQPERALYHLVTSQSGALVGIETLDDVTILLPDGRQVREQDKHYTSEKKPLSDRSKALWNTLKIWLDAIDEQGLNLALTDFYLVTNKTLESGLVFDIKNRNANGRTEEMLAAEIRRTGKSPPKKLEKLFSDVLAYPNEKLIPLLARMQIFDASSPTHGVEMRQDLRDRLHLPAAHADEIIQGLQGWIDEMALANIRAGKPVWISREAFSERYRRLLFRYQDTTFVRETTEALIVVVDDDRETRKDRHFVKQLGWIGLTEHDDDNQILEAIDAHIRSATEAARLSELGIVTVADFRAFDDNLVKRWKSLKRLYIPEPLPISEKEQQAVGRELLNQTLNHREILAGQQTSEFYLTQGAYHQLADAPPRVGWHPQYVRLAKTSAVTSEEKNGTSS